jgi:hypothetical protein
MLLVAGLVLPLNSLPIFIKVVQAVALATI